MLSQCILFVFYHVDSGHTSISSWLTRTMKHPMHIKMVRSSLINAALNPQLYLLINQELGIIESKAHGCIWLESMRKKPTGKMINRSKIYIIE